MPINGFMFRNLSILLIIVILSYFFTLQVINLSLLQNASLMDFKNSFLFQLFLFGGIFLLLTSAYIYYKVRNKKNNANTSSFQESKIRLENEQLKSSLTVDLLTHLPNKKQFEERFEEEYKRAIRDKQYVSFMIVDIDEFRSFNDIYGEDEGNECLKMIANILVAQCNRPCDLIARIHNDEFYVLLPNTSDAKTVSLKCVNAVKEMQIPHENSIASNVLTISIGISTVLPEDIIQKNQLILTAKEALMKAKRQGRNGVA
jgi:diguanylate cyclase (GGDEF)-like protein